MSFVRKSALFDPVVRKIVEDYPFVILDVGASGDMVEPWLSLCQHAPKAVSVIGFEPNDAECARLNAAIAVSGARRQYVASALWNETRDIHLHLAERPSTSSVHAPNWSQLQDYAPEHVQPRRTAKELQIPARRLDDIVAEKRVSPDFIKIDTQGAEYEIIEGAKQNLLKHCFGCTLESWTVPIHENQHLAFDVMRLMHDLDFRIFDAERTAIWQRGGKEHFKSNRGELVGMDFLYFRDPHRLQHFGAEKLLRAGLLADLWGYRKFAVELLRRASVMEPALGNAIRDIIAVIERLDRRVVIKPQSGVGRLLDQVLFSLIGTKPTHPKIH